MKMLLDFQYVPGLSWSILSALGCSSYSVVKEGLGDRIWFQKTGYKNLDPSLF